MKTIEALQSAMIIVAIILAITSVFLPWWSLRISPEAKDVLNADFSADYGLSKTVSSNFAKGTVSQNATVPLTNLTSSSDPQASAFVFMDVTTYLVIVGAVLSVPMVVAVAISRVERFLRYFIILGYISSVILLVTAIYFVSEVTAPVSHLSSLTPISPPIDWTQITPSDITSAWGSKMASASSPVTAWLGSGNFWIWLPSTGWYFAFAASLIVAVCAATLGFGLAQKARLAAIPGPEAQTVDRSIYSKTRTGERE